MKENRESGLSAKILLSIVFSLFSFTILAQENLSDIYVSVKANNRDLHSVLDDLTEQSGYFFTFDSRLFDSHRKVTMNIKDESLPVLIKTLFNSDSYKVINQNIVILTPPPALTQQVVATDTARSENIEIRGFVSDQKNGKPLAYATIAVLDSYFGTITNSDGSFLLRIPDTIQQPILISSFIGYKNEYTPIGIDSKEAISIKMLKQYISLQEVIIRYQDPSSLLQQSINSIPQNYMNTPAGMLAYYRERIHKDEKCMAFSEAVVEIAKAPYKDLSPPERTRLLKGRKITNTDIQDTVILKIRSGLSTMLQLDIIKHPPDFLAKDFKLRYDLHLANVVSFKDKLVYVISFKQHDNIQETLFQGNIYIDRENLAILAADFKYDPTRIGREQEMFVAKRTRGMRIRPISAEYYVEYNQRADKYHLSLVQGELRFKVKKRRQWIASKYQINLEMAVTNIDPGNPPKIRLSEQLKPSTIMLDQNFIYDYDFWGDYNTIAPEASLKEALSLIEQSMLEINEE